SGAEYAGGKGITLGVEDDGGLTTAAGPTIEIVKQTGSPWAGINADSGNLRVDGYSQFDSMLPYATSVHLKIDIATADGKKEPANGSRLQGRLQRLCRAGIRRGQRRSGSAAFGSDSSHAGPASVGIKPCQQNHAVAA